MNSHQRKIYSSQIKHGLEWKRHKYLYKDANGNYVYPEDVAGKAKDSLTKAGQSVKKFGQGVKESYEAGKKAGVTYAKDNKFKKDKNIIENNIDRITGVKNSADSIRKVQQMTNSHQNSTKYAGLDSYAYRIADGKKEANKKKINDQRKEEAADKAFLAERKKINQQRKSAHAGHEDYRRNFPEGGSTEELEMQKRLTADRKAIKQYRKKREKSQIASAHGTATKLKDGKLGKLKTEKFVTEELERQKRKTALRKRHKK